MSRDKQRAVFKGQTLLHGAQRKGCCRVTNDCFHGTKGRFQGASSCCHGTNNGFQRTHNFIGGQNSCLHGTHKRLFSRPKHVFNGTIPVTAGKTHGKNKPRRAATHCMQDLLLTGCPEAMEFDQYVGLEWSPDESYVVPPLNQR